MRQSSKADENTQLLAPNNSGCDQLIKRFKSRSNSESLNRFLCEFYGFSYNVVNTATYFESADNFPKHLRLVDQPISNYVINQNQLAWLGLLIPTIVAEAFLSLANQQTMPSKIAEQWKVTPYQNLCSIQRLQRYAAVWKAVVSITSFGALANDAFSAIGLVDHWSLIPAGVCAIILFIPNFVCQFLNFKDPTSKSSITKGSKCSVFWASFCSVGYGFVSGFALYFNTGNRILSPLDLGVLSELDSALKKVLFSFHLSLSVNLGYATTRTYYQMILDDANENAQHPTVVKETLQDWLGFSRQSAVVFKTILTISAFINFIQGFDNLTATYTALFIAGLFLPGNYLAQKIFFLGKREGNPSQICNGYCPNLFSITHQNSVSDNEDYRLENGSDSSASTEFS